MFSNLTEDFYIEQSSKSIVKTYLWNPWLSTVLILIYSIAGAVSIFLKSLIIKYILFDAPPKRPVNFLIGLDQV